MRKKKKIIIKAIAAFIPVAILFSCVLITCFKNDSIFGYVDDDRTNDVEWYLTLVNNNNPIPQNYDFELTELSNGNRVDSRIYPYLQEMFDDMRSSGIYPTVREGYRTSAQQEQIMNDKIDAYINEGYSRAKAGKLASETVAKVGYSEHQLGLAVDINADPLHSSNTEVYTWLAENAYKYGFILRYPANKTNITQIDFEPWHYRYVGKEAAFEIFSSDVCLEEYLERNR